MQKFTKAVSKHHAKALRDRTMFKPFLDLKGSNYSIDKKLQQRGVGDFIEGLCVEVATVNYPFEFRARTSVKSTEDFSLVCDGVLNFIDIKTHNVNKSFCMPNLTAVERLKDIYSLDRTCMHYIMVDYTLVNGVLTITNVHHCMPHNLPWNNLAIANLGLGQLQIKNMHKLKIDYTLDKMEWFEEFKFAVLDFKHKLIEKTRRSIFDWEDRELAEGF